MRSKILDENFSPVTFRVVDHEENVLEESVDANDLEVLKALSERAGTSNPLILQISCGNPDRCKKGWHNALLFFGGELWVAIEAVQGPPMGATMIAVGRFPPPNPLIN